MKRFLTWTGQKKYDNNVEFLQNILQKSAVYHWPTQKKTKKQKNNKNALGLYEKKTYRNSTVRTYPLHHIPAYNIPKLYVSLIKKKKKNNITSLPLCNILNERQKKHNKCASLQHSLHKQATCCMTE